MSRFQNDDLFGSSTLRVVSGRKLNEVGILEC